MQIPKFVRMKCQKFIVYRQISIEYQLLSPAIGRGCVIALRCRNVISLTKQKLFHTQCWAATVFLIPWIKQYCCWKHCSLAPGSSCMWSHSKTSPYSEKQSWGKKKKILITAISRVDYLMSQAVCEVSFSTKFSWELTEREMSKHTAPHSRCGWSFVINCHQLPQIIKTEHKSIMRSCFDSF